VEQLIYTAIGSGERSGYQVCSRSPGLSSNDLAILEGVFGFHGPAPNDFPSSGVLSVIQIRAGYFCAWKTYRREGNAADSRRALWVHAFVFSEDEFQAMEYDPYALCDAQLFKQPCDAVSKDLPRAQPPKPAQRSQATALFDLKAIEIDALCASLFSRKHCYLSWDGMTGDRMRAVQILFPRELRRRLTFYGMVSGTPATKAKIILSSQAIALGQVDTSCSGAASIEDGRYRGENPSAYACAIAEYLKSRNQGGMLQFIRFAESMGDDVLASGGAALVKLHARGRELVEQRGVAELVSCCAELSRSASPEAVRRFRNDVLLGICEHALGEGQFAAVTEAATELLHPGGPMCNRDMTRLGACAEAVMSSAIQDPRLLVMALRLSQHCHHDVTGVVKALLQNFGDVVRAVRRQMRDNSERVRFWEEVAATARSCGHNELAAEADVMLIMDSIKCSECMERDMLAACLTSVRTPEQLQRVRDALFASRPRSSHVPLVRHLLTRSRTDGCLALKKWMPWAICDEAVWQILEDELRSRSEGHAEAALEVVDAAWRDNELDATAAFRLLASMEQVCSGEATALRFARSVPPDERVSVALDTYRRHGEAAARPILSSRGYRQAMSCIEAVRRRSTAMSRKEERVLSKLAHESMRMLTAALGPSQEGLRFRWRAIAAITLSAVVVSAGAAAVVWWKNWWPVGAERRPESVNRAQEVDWRKEISLSGESLLRVYGSKVQKGWVISEAAIIRDVNVVADAWASIAEPSRGSLPPEVWALTVLSVTTSWRGHALLTGEDVKAARKVLSEQLIRTPLPAWSGQEGEALPDWHADVARQVADLRIVDDSYPVPLTLSDGTLGTPMEAAWRRWHGRDPVKSIGSPDAHGDEAELWRWAVWAVSKTIQDVDGAHDEGKMTPSSTTSPSSSGKGVRLPGGDTGESDTESPVPEEASDGLSE